MLYKGDHLLRTCPGIPKVLEVWSTGSHQPLSSASGDHAGDKLSTSKAHGKKGKVKFPCKLCEGNHPIHLCPLIDEASKWLENITASQPRLLTTYRKLSPDPSLIDPMIDQKSYLVNPALFESESRESVLDQPLVEENVGLVSPQVVHAVPKEHHDHTAHVLIV